MKFRPTRLSPALRQLALPRACRGLANVTPQLPEQSYGNLPSSQSPITPTMHFFNSVVDAGKQIPTYRVIDGAGQPLEGAEVPEVRLVCSREECHSLRWRFVNSWTRSLRATCECCQRVLVEQVTHANVYDLS